MSPVAPSNYSRKNVASGNYLKTYVAQSSSSRADVAPGDKNIAWCSSG